MVIGSTVYSCSFFKKINSDGSFHVSKDSQHDLLYWLLHLELFSLSESQGFSTIWAKTYKPEYFQFNIIVANSCLVHSNIFLTKTCFSLHLSHSFVKFTFLQFITSKNLMTEFCSSLEHSCLIFCHFE